MIRPAKNEDVIKINNLGRLLYFNFEKLYNISEYLNNDKFIILINEDSIINGFIIVYKNIDYYELEIIVVAENSRKKGIATNLLHNFIDNYCLKNDKILLEVSSVNFKALKLYEKFNFRTINTRKKYYNDSDAYIMEKVI